MTFTKLDADGCYSSEASLNEIAKLSIDRTLLKHKLTFKQEIIRPLKNSLEGREKFKAIWVSKVYWKNTLLIDFEADQSYLINFDGTAPANEDLKEIVINCYKHMQYTVQKTVDQLQSALKQTSRYSKQL